MLIAYLVSEHLEQVLNLSNTPLHRHPFSAHAPMDNSIWNTNLEQKPSKIWNFPVYNGDAYI